MLEYMLTYHAYDNSVHDAGLQQAAPNFPAYIYNDYYYASIFDTSYEANLETKLHNQEFIIKDGSIMNSYYNVLNTTVICTVHTLFLRPS